MNCMGREAKRTVVILPLRFIVLIVVIIIVIPFVFIILFKTCGKRLEKLQFVNIVEFCN